MGGRRGALLAEVARALVFFGAEPFEDLSVGELARTAQTLAIEYRTSDRGHGIRQAGDLLERAATELSTADRFRSAPLSGAGRDLHDSRPTRQ